MPFLELEGDSDSFSRSLLSGKVYEVLGMRKTSVWFVFQWGRQGARTDYHSLVAVNAPTEMGAMTEVAAGLGRMVREAPVGMNPRPVFSELTRKGQGV